MKVISTPGAPASLAGDSQGVKAAGLVFVAGQGPFEPTTGKVVGVTIQEQTAQCLRNIEAILKASGSSLEKVVNATLILGDGNDYGGMNEEWARWFPENPSAW